jgi:XTP/dITP diphosphohydrolase
MKLVLATGNKGKLREFKQMFKEDILVFSDILGHFEIIEDGHTFAENALIKAKTIYEKLDKNYIVISDDSGISVPILDNEPNIYSARYAGEGATDKENLEKLITKLKEKNIETSPAFYTASIAIVSKYGEYVVHGWMFGQAINHARGEKGFGYDPIFIPEGFDQTLGELDDKTKKELSHRAKALSLAKPLIAMLQRK